MPRGFDEEVGGHALITPAWARWEAPRESADGTKFVGECRPAAKQCVQLAR